MESLCETVHSHRYGDNAGAAHLELVTDLRHKRTDLLHEPLNTALCTSFQKRSDGKSGNRPETVKFGKKGTERRRKFLLSSGFGRRSRLLHLFVSVMSFSRSTLQLITAFGCFIETCKFAITPQLHHRYPPE